MKKTFFTLALVLTILTSQAQNWNGLSGTWRPISPSNVSSLNSITFVQLLSPSQIKISTANNVHTIFDLKSIPNNGAEITEPLEIKQIYGYDAKKIFVRIYNQSNKLRVVRKIYEYDRNGTVLNRPTADSVLFEYVTINKGLKPIGNANIVDSRIKPIGASTEEFRDKKEFLNGTQYKIEFLSLHNLVGDSDGEYDANKDLEIIGGFKCVVRDDNKKAVSQQKQIYFHSNSNGNPVILQKAQPISLSSAIDFSVTKGDYQNYSLLLTGTFEELHRKLGYQSAYLESQGYYLKENTDIKIEELKLSDTYPGDNMIELDLRMGKTKDGENTKIGIKVRITKIN